MKENTYKTILVITIGFLVLFLIFEKNWMIYSGFAVGLGALISPVIAEWILKAWFQIGKILGYINSRILLSIIYFLILVPLAALSRMMVKGDKFLLKRSNLNSYYEERNHVYSKADLENPW